LPIEIANESGADVDEHALADLAAHVLDRLGVSALAELSVLLVDVPAMTALHERWMDEPGPTDVLAFPQDELADGRPADVAADAPPTLLGDVVLCPDVAARQARDAGHAPAAELALLCTHGILHLLGYDHAEADEAREMTSLQSRLLASWRALRAASSPTGAPKGRGGAGGARDAR
jgi:probable rRNA maturation factor